MRLAVAAALLLSVGGVARATPVAPVADAREVAKAKAPKRAKVVPTAKESLALLRTLRASEVVVEELARRRELFDRPADQPLTPDEKMQLLDLWATAIDYEVTFDAVKDRFRHSWYSAKWNNDEAKAYVAAYAAYVGQQRMSMAIVEATTGKPAYETLLNEPHPEVGVGANHLDRVKKHALSAKAALVLRSGRDFLESLDARFLEAGVLEEGPLKDVVWHTREAWERTDKAYWRSGFKLWAQSTLGFAKDGFFGALFPVQKGVAEWMGDTRVAPQERALIKPEQLEALQKRMEPGDVLLARRNWYLSNIGLPGFWPHAELYSGTVAQLEQYFDGDPEIRKLWPAGFTKHLATEFPEKWREYTRPNLEDGQPHAIIEAVSEGVVFASIFEGALADYVGVLRPRLTKVEKARAIERAFAARGKPYDFDFDFLSDETLVCSELVYKSYQAPSVEGRSLHLELSKVAGRTTMPVNEFVRTFDVEFDRPERQFDFVAFLDGREATSDAIEATEAAFRLSYKRVKWDIAQR